MKNEIKLSILLKTSDMYNFLLQHTYSNFSGYFGVFISLGALIYLLVSFQGNDTFKNVILLLVALLFTVINPLMLLSKAKQQIMLNPMFKEPLEYMINEEVIIVKQKDQQMQIGWDEVNKVVETRKCIIIYITAVRAYIFPKSSLNEDYYRFTDIIKQVVDKSKIKLKQKRVK
jgi:hypothetical protein